MALDQKIGNAHRTLSSSNSAGAATTTRTARTPGSGANTTTADPNKALPPRPSELRQTSRHQRFPIALPATSSGTQQQPPSRVGAAPDSPSYSTRSPILSRSDSDRTPANSRNSHLSFVSIVDDPFFQQYRTLDDPVRSRTPLDPVNNSSNSNININTTVTDDDDNEGTIGSPAAGDETIVPEVETPRDESGRRWPPPRRESLTIGQFLSWPQQPSNEMASLNIAVIGATGVGKSGFIERVMDLSRPPLSNASQARKVVDGVAYLVTVLELDLEHFELDPQLPIQWPRQINGHIIPRVDGALIIYDVTVEKSLHDLPKTLAALTNSGLPTILVANKCDVHDEDKLLDPQIIAEHHYFQPCVATYELSASDPESGKACLNAILKAASTNKMEHPNLDPSIPRRRAQSAANILEATLENGRPLSVASKHSRASSDLSVLQTLPVPASGYGPRGVRLGHSNSSHSSIGEEDPTKQTVSSLLRSTGVRLDRAPSDSFLDVDVSDSESFRYSEEVPILQRNDDTLSEKPRPVGVTFDDLVDRLLQFKMSRADNQFTDIFLCLYRKFAAPGELLRAILVRLDQVRDDKAAHPLSTTATQLQIIEVVAKWVSLYPGDFARPGTRRTLVDFIDHLSTEPIFFIAAQQMRRNVDNNVTEDDDTGWAKSDDVTEPVPPPKMLSKEPISLPDLSNFGSLSLGVNINFDERPSTTTDLSHLNQGSAYSTHFQFNSSEEYERAATFCEPSPQLALSKMRYRMFMEMADNEIADELTRMDWIMFSSIRIRDFVRHVSLSVDQKDKCRSLKNMNRMVQHFNHIAKWVANMILFRDKAKHRALCLEKFMNIATRLRTMNNYNGLAAVLAGINGMPIHRLQNTRSMVATEVQKRFARLVILMGTQKSHFAYRLAWENSSFPRIPFMPLHRRDLVSAEEGGKTMIGPQSDRINWKKFEVLGEVLMPIMRSQGTAYPNMMKHEAIRELILETRLPADDEELYTRSEQLEAPAGANDGGYRKKFAWLRMGV